MAAKDMKIEADGYMWRPPLEIRENIYRFLLLDPPTANAGPVWKAGDNWRYIRNEETGKAISRTKDVDDTCKTIKYPAIIRANRKIYQEACSLMYSKLKIRLQPPDLVRIQSPYGIGSSSDILSPSVGVWRHAPWEDFKVEASTGQARYEGPELDGRMEPHVFARFEKVAFDAHFELDEFGSAPRLFVQANKHIRPKDETNLTVFLQRTEIIDILVKLLSHSPFVRLFELTLSVRVMAESEEDGLDWSSPEHRDGRIRADERAVELLLESGILNTLCELSNVRSFRWAVQRKKWEEPQVHGFPNFVPFRLPQKHSDILDSLKDTIQRRYVPS